MQRWHVRFGLSLACSSLLALDAAPAVAQQPSPQAPSKLPATAAAAPEAQATQPRPIEIDDPLLAPAPRASRVLKDWREALALLSARSLDMQIAAQEIERAEGLSRQALARALPTVTAIGSIRQDLIRYEGTEPVVAAIPITITGPNGPIQTSIPVDTGQRVKVVPPFGRSATASISASQPILAPRAWHSIKTAGMQADVARQQLSDRRRTQLGAVANAIVAVVTAERVSEISRVGLRSALERLELTERRLRLGTGTRLDSVRAEQDVASARATLISGDESLRQAQEALGLVLGSTDAYGVPPSISLNEIEQTVQTICTPGGVNQRPDVAAARTELRIAERHVTEVRLGFLPTAEVSTTAAISTLEPQIGPSRPYSWSIEGVLTIPIYDGGARYGELRSARASVEQQKARLESARRLAQIETTQAVRGVAVAERSRDVAGKTRDLAKETARLSKVAFEAGTGTSFDLVDSARREREAELDLAVKEFEVIKTKIAALLAAANCTY
jgi:outer membrane protein TolC